MTRMRSRSSDRLNVCLSVCVCLARECMSGVVFSFPFFQHLRVSFVVFTNIKEISKQRNRLICRLGENSRHVLERRAAVPLAPMGRGTLLGTHLGTPELSHGDILNSRHYWQGGITILSVNST